MQKVLMTSSTIRCECCGHFKPRLTWMQERIVEVIISKMVVCTADLASTLYGNRLTWEKKRTTFTHLYYLRQNLKRQGFVLETKPFRIYKLVPDESAAATLVPHH